MVRKRPCRVCRRWFQPDPRAGDRQRVCSRPECQQERHRRNCVAWRDRERASDEERRVRVRLLDLTQPEGSPGARLLPAAVRDAVGLEVAVLAREIVRHVDLRTRDPVPVQLAME